MPGSVTDKERDSGRFDAFKPTQADYDMYARYSTVRLRILAWWGDTVAKRILESRKWPAR
jgi:hypothetical protein